MFLLVVIVCIIVGLLVIKFLDLARRFDVLETYTSTVATLEDVDERINALITA
jgi:hypothetical protein